MDLFILFCTKILSIFIFAFMIHFPGFVVNFLSEHANPKINKLINLNNNIYCNFLNEIIASSFFAWISNV